MKPTLLALFLAAGMASTAIAQMCITTDRGQADDGATINLVPDGWPPDLLSAFNQAMTMWNATACNASDMSFPTFRTGTALPGEFVVDVQFESITSNVNLFNTCGLTSYPGIADSDRLGGKRV